MRMISLGLKVDKRFVAMVALDGIEPPSDTGAVAVKAASVDAFSGPLEMRAVACVGTCTTASTAVRVLELVLAFVLALVH